MISVRWWGAEKDPDTGGKSALHTDCAVAQYDRSSRDGAGPTRLMDLAGISWGGNAGARYEKANGDLIPV